MYKSTVEGKGGITAKVVADSIANDIRIVTMELNYPRFIHEEMMTHRQFSRNASSSRAIPVAKMIEQVETNPAIPIHWGKNQSGMQAYEEVSNTASSEWLWKGASTESVVRAETLSKHGLHKQIVNRLLEPFQFIKVVITATEYDNFFALRNHHAAQPEIQELARVMKQAQDESTPTELEVDGWHTPYITDEEWLDESNTLDTLIRCSAARCARVSYLNHDNSQPDIQKDLELYDMLATRPYDNGTLKLDIDEPVHLSPLEHQATPMPYVMWGSEQVGKWDKGVTHVDKNLDMWSGNFSGFVQHRQLLQEQIMPFLKFRSLENHYNVNPIYLDMEEEVAVSEKLDGSNLSVVVDKHLPEIRIASRNQLVETTWHGIDALLPIEALRDLIFDIGPSDINIFGEVFSSSILKRIPYGETQIAFYSVAIDGVYLSPQDAYTLLEEYKLPTVPYTTMSLKEALQIDVETLKTAYAEDSIAEGIVISPLIRNAFNDKVSCIKYKSEKFLEQSKAKKTMKPLELNETQQTFLSLLNENRVLSFVSKQADSLDKTKVGEYIKAIGDDAMEDLKKKLTPDQLMVLDTRSLMKMVGKIIAPLLIRQIKI